MGSENRTTQRSAAAIGALLALCTITWAMPDAWITWRGWGNGTYANYIYLWNSGTHEIRQLYHSNSARPHDYVAFSPDGKQVALIIKTPNDTGGIWTVNNDGTGAKRVCATFAKTTLTYSSIQWTRRGLFWTENDRQIYWADPATGQSKALGTLTANTNANILSVSLDGSRAYLRAEHEISPGIGGIFFEIPAALNGLLNERVTNNVWDHGSCMLADGRAAVWIMYSCAAIGNPTGCSYHSHMGLISFADMSATALVPTDLLPHDASGYNLCGPGIGLHRAPNSSDHIIYKLIPRTGDGWSDPHYYIQNVVTGENMDVTPTAIAAGGPISDPTIIYNECGEFWLGALPNPHDSTPSIATDKSSLLFNNQALPIRPDTVRVTNRGGGTLGSVALRVVPAAAWLTLTRAGVGNAQTIQAAVSATGLASGTYATTVTVSGGGASDSATFTVTLSVGAAVQAPTNLVAAMNSGSVLLSWADNANNETGFGIERRITGGIFASLATAAVNATSFTDTAVVQGTTYEYRVRATNATASSTWSDTATIAIPLPAIVVTAPAAGALWPLGSQQHIRWSAPTIQSVQIHITVNDGETWDPLLSSGSISQSNAAWGDYVWTVPLQYGVQAAAQIRVSEYQNVGTSGYSGVFSLTNGNSAVSQVRAPVAGARARPAHLVDLRGRTIAAVPTHADRTRVSLVKNCGNFGVVMAR